MKVIDNKMIFQPNEKVICINKGSSYVLGTLFATLIKGKYTLLVRLDDQFKDKTKLKWEYTVPYCSHLHQWLDEQDNIEQQYVIIKEHNDGIIVNQGRRT